MLFQKLLGASTNRPLIRFLTGVNLANQASDATRTLTLSSGFQIGDMLVAMTGRRNSSPPSQLSGYTDIVSVRETFSGSGRSLRVQYKIARSTSETITWNGAYGYLLAFRNARAVGQAATFSSSASVTTISLPTLTGLRAQGREFVLAGSYVTSDYTSATTPYRLLSVYGAQIPNNTNSSVTGASIVSSTSQIAMSYAVELI